MKAIKTLLAVSLLAAGAAHAATIGTATLTATSQIPIGPGTYLNNGSGTGTATLDDSGTLTLNWSGNTTVLFTNVMAVSFSDVATGTIAGGTFTMTGGHTHINSCSPVSGTNFCADALSTPENTFTSNISGSIALALGASGTFTASYQSPGGQVNNTYNLSNFTPAPAVPVPAAAWLFGSGLLGLAGTARRRKVA